MDCTTSKPGIACSFMSTKGCSYNGGSCHTVVDSCNGCGNVIEFDSGSFCRSFPDPSAKWKRGTCNFATHVAIANGDKQKINPLKASKRGSR